jgi:hypothetical protein
MEGTWMHEPEYTFLFSSDVDLDEATGTLRHSLMAAEGLYGEARVRTEVSFAIEPVRAAIRVSGVPPILDSVTQIFASLLTREFGRDAFTVRRDAAPQAVPAA